MNIVRWEILREMVTLRQAMGRLFNDSFVNMPHGDGAEAIVDNGVLTLEIPKTEEVKPRAVKVKAKAETKKLQSKETKESKH